MRVHYRVIGPLGKVTAYGCGWAGEPNASKTNDAGKVTCDACKRTKEWKAARTAPRLPHATTTTTTTNGDE